MLNCSMTGIVFFLFSGYANYGKFFVCALPCFNNPPLAAVERIELTTHVWLVDTFVQGNFHTSALWI